MKQASILTAIASDYLIAAVLIVVPFQAFLTVWASTLVGHYTALRLWDDVVLLALMSFCCFWLARDTTLRQWFTASLLVRLIFAYAGLTLLLGLISYIKGDVTLKALAYGVLINVRFLAWFLVVLLGFRRSPQLRARWLKLLLIPAAIVVAFAALQFTVLPHDFLVHFGYHSATTIAPTETINHNAHYLRVQSTLRGANPLGAYLVIVLSALGVLLVRGKRKVLCAGFGALALFALYASGSRSAWIGTLLSLGVIAWFQLKTQRQQVIFGVASLVIAITAVVGYLVLKNNTGLQNAVLHTQNHSAVAISSNAAHASALRSGVKDVLQQPFGEGPGTAGPASEYNGSHPARIAENYYVQIAQETGWLGLILFLSVVILVALELYAQIGDSRLALVALASLAGLSFVNMLSHAWADDTLAYVWWGLAAIALTKPIAKPARKAAKS